MSNNLITTNAELDALPAGAVVGGTTKYDRYEWSLKEPGGHWGQTGDWGGSPETYFPLRVISLPITPE